MTKRTWVTAALVVAACCALLLWRRAPTPQKTGPGEGGTAAETNQAEEASRPKTAADAQRPPTPAPPDFPANIPRPRITPEQSNTAYQTLLTAWQAPIDFYGKVVDESGNAVAGANIQFRWIETPAEGGERESSVQSDAEGLFSLNGKVGRSLTVWVSKEGYRASHGGQRTFLYSASDRVFKPDPRDPVPFVLRRKGQGAELVTSENGIRPNLAVRIPKSGVPVRVDFFQKRASPTGQLEISQNKPPWREATGWSFRMSLPDGGFVENDDEFQFEAPQSGYRPSVEYRFTKSESNWVTHATMVWYIAFGEPRKYGCLRLESDIAQETVFITYAINPSGSRNLEPVN